MRKTLLATTALAFAGALAAGPALAADKMSVGVGGYMQQWIGTADRTDDSDEGGVDIQSDSEIYFQGSMDSDMGLKFGVHVQLEANNEEDEVKDNDGNSLKKPHNTEIDESFAYISGDFGRLEIGQRDPVHARTHYGIKDVGVGLNAGDTQKWIPGAYLDTNGWIGDNLNVIYISPRMNGVQVGVSYGADSGSENSVTSAPKNNDNAVVAGGINLNQELADASVKISLGHRAAGTDGDDDTFTNMGLAVSTGAFGFNVAYAERDKGTGMPKDEWSVVGASVSYAEGPVSVSLGHMLHDVEDGTERNATMLSASYSLAPGVAWKSSVFGVEDTTKDTEGTAFVTGITLGF